MNCLKLVFQTNGDCFFVFLIINQYCTPKMCSKQVRGYLLVYSSLISIVRLFCYSTKNVFKKSNYLLFSLLCHFFNTKSMFSKQAGTCVLIYYSTFLIWKNVYSNQVRGCYFPNTKNACSKQVGGCFSVYSVTFWNMKNVCSKQAGG